MVEDFFKNVFLLIFVLQLSCWDTEESYADVIKVLVRVEFGDTSVLRYLFARLVVELGQDLVPAGDDLA